MIDVVAAVLVKDNKILIAKRKLEKKQGGYWEYVRHNGNKPISIVWKLDKEIPASMINKANKSIVI